MRLLTQALTARTASPTAAARLLVLFLLITFAVETLVMLLLPWIVPADASPIVIGCLDAMLLTVILGPIAWRVFLTPLALLHDARGRLMGHVLSAHEEERSRISRDLHDGLGQSLTSGRQAASTRHSSATAVTTDGCRSPSRPRSIA